MATGVTSSGFEWDVPDDIGNDMELLENIIDLDAGDGRALVPVVRKVIGGQKAALYDHVREADGRVPIDKLTKEIGEILNAVKATKKS